MLIKTLISCSIIIFTINLNFIVQASSVRGFNSTTFASPIPEGLYQNRQTRLMINQYNSRTIEDNIELANSINNFICGLKNYFLCQEEDDENY